MKTRSDKTFYQELNIDAKTDLQSIKDRIAKEIDLIEQKMRLSLRERWDHIKHNRPNETKKADSQYESYKARLQLLNHVATVFANEQSRRAYDHTLPFKSKEWHELPDYYALLNLDPQNDLSTLQQSIKKEVLNAHENLSYLEKNGRVNETLYKEWKSHHVILLNAWENFATAENHSRYDKALNEKKGILNDFNFYMNDNENLNKIKTHDPVLFQTLKSIIPDNIARHPKKHDLIRRIANSDLETTNAMVVGMQHLYYELKNRWQLPDNHFMLTNVSKLYQTAKQHSDALTPQFNEINADYGPLKEDVLKVLAKRKTSTTTGENKKNALEQLSKQLNEADAKIKTGFTTKEEYQQIKDNLLSGIEKVKIASEAQQKQRLMLFAKFFKSKTAETANAVLTDRMKPPAKK